MSHIFMTGGTGFLGKSILKALSSGSHTVTMLVRSQQKFEQLLEQLQLKTSTWITPVVGDLTKPGLGLHDADYRMAASADIVLHAGGPMDILLEEQEARRVFLQAAEEILHLAQDIHQSKGLQHFIHIVGFKSPFHEDNMHTPELIVPLLETQPPYERMKFLADLHIREAANRIGFPLSVVHPSVVIGDSTTGNTEQTGGLGILVDSTRRRLMRLVPGGEAYWLPLVHVDHVAAFVAALTEERPQAAASQTYYLLEPMEDSPRIPELVSRIAKELRVPGPIGSLPLPLLSKILDTRLGKRLRIPKESMDFIVKESFPVEAYQQVQHKYNLSLSLDSAALSHVIADLDFRLSHPATHSSSYRRNRRGPVATLERDGQGDPIIFLHGTLSSADCLMPLADHLPGSPVWLMDIPGFGRSPYHHEADVLEGHVHAIVQAILSQSSKVTLVGHSYGAYLAAKVFEAIPERIHAIKLLQPVLQPAPMRYSSSLITEKALALLTQSSLTRMLLSQSCFETVQEMPDNYVSFIIEELRSPRVRKTTAGAMAALTRKSSFNFDIKHWTPDKVSILWGTHERIYHLPEPFRPFLKAEITAGHYFPLSHPEWTAMRIREEG